ncbi:hypothetical protein [Paenibacillus paridis]|uniref:hypothetical protein n=1 Tax=Paenibacillus paridis TaxID=2583376 RepID=UPI00111FFE77|nr:hypothetical protein [Paenibacillus paridis]
MNVTMGANATLSWSQVTNQPSAAALGGLMANSTKLTHINANGIYTGTLTADQIIAGKISADYIDTTNLAAQRIFQKGYSDNYVEVGGDQGDLKLHYNGTNFFTIYNGGDFVRFKHFDDYFLHYSGANKAAKPLGTWDFSEAEVKGVTAVFG